MTRPLPTVAYLLFLAALTGCIESRRIGHAEDGGDRDGASPGSDLLQPRGDHGQLAADAGSRKGDAGAGDKCVVAVRVDNCCGRVEAMRLAVVNADPCIMLWPLIGPYPSECLARWEKRCETVDCASSAPPTRSATEVDGRCVFTSECQSSDECTSAINLRACCGCLQAVPRELLSLQKCLVQPNAPNAQPWPADCGPADCPAVLCGMCREPQGVFCLHGDDYSRCVEAWAD